MSDITVPEDHNKGCWHSWCNEIVLNQNKKYSVGEVSVSDDRGGPLWWPSVIYILLRFGFLMFLNYHYIIYKQTVWSKVMGFDHFLIPVINIANSIRSQTTQHRRFKVLSEELSAEYGYFLLHMEIWWFSRGSLQHFLSLVAEIKNAWSLEGRTRLCCKWILDLMKLFGRHGNSWFANWHSIQSQSGILTLLGFCGHKKKLHTKALRVASLFGLTYVCESASSDIIFIKTNLLD